jgi:hypothetical protein
MRAREDLTNVQLPILNSHPKGEAAACVRAVLIEAETAARLMILAANSIGHPTSTSDEN